MPALNGQRAVPVEIGEKTYLLRYDFNALVALEEALGSTKINFQDLGFKGQRALLWAALAHGTEKNVTLAEVGEMLSPYLKDAKRYGEIVEAAAKAYAQAFPEVEEADESKKTLTQTAGTGI